MRRALESASARAPSRFLTAYGKSLIVVKLRADVVAWSFTRHLPCLPLDLWRHISMFAGIAAVVIGVVGFLYIRRRGARKRQQA